MARKSRVFSYKVQVSVVTILVCLLLTATTILSLDQAGIIHLKDDIQDPNTNSTLSGSILRFEVVNGTETNYIQSVISSLTVQFTCSARNVSHCHWDFGDNQGAEGLVVINEYAEPGTYLVEATIMFLDGDKVIEYYYLELDGGVLYNVDVPGVGHIWTFYTFSLLLSGIFSLIWFTFTFYNRQKNGTHIWPKAFTPELRLLMGFGLIFCYFLAIGFFNGIIASIMTVVGL